MRIFEEIASREVLTGRRSRFTRKDFSTRPTRGRPRFRHSDLGVQTFQETDQVPRPRHRVDRLSGRLSDSLFPGSAASSFRRAAGHSAGRGDRRGRFRGLEELAAAQGTQGPDRPAAEAGLAELHGAPCPVAGSPQSLQAGLPKGAGEASAERIVRMIRDFRLESATPVQCVMFIAELKQRIDGDL